MAANKLKTNLIIGLSLGALIGVAACGSFQMPESMKMDGMFSEDAAGSSATSQTSATGVELPPKNAQPMSSSEFEGLRARVADEGMSSNKIQVVEDAGRSSYFSAAQVGELAALLAMKGDRVKLVEAVAVRILDLNNPDAITSMLTFADERSDVESIMSKALAARGKEQARVAEAARVAEEKRIADDARIAEEQRVSEENRRAEEAERAQTATSTTSTSTSKESSSSDSAYCCINGSYNSCDSAAAAGSCAGWGMCFFECQMDGKGNCDEKCAEKYPLIRECRAEPSKDSSCKK